MTANSQNADTNVGAAALKLALELARVPSRVPHARSSALPSGLPALLQIAAGDTEALSRAAKQTGQPEAALCEAAAFFIEQILLAPGADSYRVLGVHPGASTGELRRNMALLLKWLHPDVQSERDRSIFARRAARAWDDLKTPERRAAYDALLRSQTAGSPTSRPSPARRPQQQGARLSPVAWTHPLRRAWRRVWLYFLGQTET